MKKLAKLTAMLIAVMGITACKPHTNDTVKIGIIEPIEHTAMNEIVAGFTESLHTLYQKPVTIRVENAQNDPNLQRAIIQKMRDAGYTMIVPIGVAASQMTLAMVHNQPVVSLAADISEQERQKLNPCNVAIVHDEISAQQLLQFIHAAYPQLTQLTLVHSAADKVLPQVQEAIAAGKQYGIKIDHLMISALPDLYSASQALSPNTQAIFVLKDNLIVSGIPTLAKAAADHHIPLITSDEGSVKAGAGIALGVREREIGTQGGKLAAQILNGQAICSLPIVEMKNLTVFINSKALQDQKEDAQAINLAAKQLGYVIQTVDK